MKVTLLLVTLLAVFSISFAAVGRYPPKESGKPGHCWIKEVGPLKKGETKDIPKECAEAVCNDDTSVLLVSCSSVEGPNGATKGDFSKPYPQCCPQPIYTAHQLKYQFY